MMRAIERKDALLACRRLRVIARDDEQPARLRHVVRRVPRYAYRPWRTWTSMLVFHERVTLDVITHSWPR
jgi:hypothetical protein